MKKLLLLMLPLTALTFIACDKGDDNGGNETITGKPVKTIYYDGHDDLFEFFYDDKQRIIKIIETPIGEHLYGYSNNNRITWFHPYYETTRLYTLDNNGYVIKMNDENYTEEYEYSNGYLSKLISRNDDIVTSTAYFTWEDGNLTRITEDNYTYQYRYTNVENKLNLNIFQVLYEDYPFFYEYSKFKGASPKNYPANTENGDDTITYILDSDGYPTEIRISNPDPDGYVSTITITYY